MILNLTKSQKLVYDYFFGRGPDGACDLQMTDELCDKFSTLRTRREELTHRNIILDTGRRRPWGDTDRLRTVWVHRHHVASPPPVLARAERPARQMGLDDLAEALLCIAEDLEPGAAAIVRRAAQVARGRKRKPKS